MIEVSQCSLDAKSRLLDSMIIVLSDAMFGRKMMQSVVLVEGEHLGAGGLAVSHFLISATIDAHRRTNSSELSLSLHSKYDLAQAVGVRVLSLAVRHWMTSKMQFVADTKFFLLPDLLLDLLLDLFRVLLWVPSKSLPWCPQQTNGVN